MLSSKVALTFLQRVNKASVMPLASVHIDKRGYGEREVVGWGVNAIPHYIDRVDFPFPSIRYKEDKGDIPALREKEKGDWKNLTIEEKKALYRASFCQTFSEFEAPTGEWKKVLGWTFGISAVGIWIMFILKNFVFPPLPETFSEERREAQLRRMLDLKVNPITGVSSKWDYEKDDWKK